MFAFAEPLLAAQTVTAGPLKPLGHHELLLLLLQLSLLLLAARGLGELMRRVNLPPVVGELLAGVVLGPSLFGLLLPGLQAAIFPKSQAQADLLSVVSWLGVLFLLVATGLETDLKLIVSKGKNALLISLGGILVPFVTGFALGQYLPAQFLANPDDRLVFSLFMATAMSISAIPVIAKVLIDLKLIRRDIGQITLAAGMTDDSLGWILLSVVAGLATSGQINLGAVLSAVGGAVAFLAVAITVGRPVFARLLQWVDDQIGGASAQLTTVLILAFAAAALTHQLGIEAALGAFTVGILAGQAPRFSREAGHTLETITSAFLAPIFFAAAGLKVNLPALLEPTTFVIGLLVLAIACFGKFVGVYVGARVGGLGHWEGLALGSGMNARGAMEIIVATIGLSLGVLTPQMYSIVVMVAIVTSLMAPPLLRWTLSKVVMGEDEARRLQMEELAGRSFLKSIRRVLLPTRGGANSQLAAQLVSHIAQHNEMEVTALYAECSPNGRRKGDSSAADNALKGISEEMNLPRSPTTRIESGRDPAEVILREATKGYNLIVLGATERGDLYDGTLFNSLVDRVVQDAPCATLVVRSLLPVPVGDGPPIAPQKIRHILVPTIGTEYSKHAVEVAAAIGAQIGALVTLVHVINLPIIEDLYVEQYNFAADEIAQQIVDQQADLGRTLGAQVNTEVLKGTSPEKEILAYAHTHEVDLIVLGSNIRPISGRVFFGHRVDALLRQATCPVAVVSSS
jgi:Kef-type K+ transport system membrane component KefB/nucleotide-binding universal stress UspA family protein